MTVSKNLYCPVFNLTNVDIPNNLRVGGTVLVEGSLTFSDAIVSSFTSTMGDGEVFTITATDASGGAVAPFTYTSNMPIAGSTGGRALFITLPTAQLGSYANAIKGYLDFAVTAQAGGLAGLGSAICAELRMPNGAVTGHLFPLEIEWVGQANTAFGVVGTGAASGFMWLKANGTVTDFDSDGVFMTVQGLTAGAGKLLSAQSITLRCDVGYGTLKYLVMSTAENNLTLATTGGTSISIGACTTAVAVTGATTNALSVTGTCSGAAISVTGASLQTLYSVFNVGAQLGQYVQGIKIEHTRSADIQPSTGGWWGAQIVLNAGTGYTALDKTAYVLHCVFKGDATDPSSQTVNVARFETQSNGKVEDLLFVSANSGSTVTGDVARFVAHVAPTRAILALQNGTTGSTPAGLYIDVDETMTTGIVFDTGAAITNLMRVTAATNTSYFLLADAEAGCFPNYSSAGSAIANIKIKIGSTDGYIKVYDAA